MTRRPAPKPKSRGGKAIIVDYSIYRGPTCPSCAVAIGSTHLDACAIARCMLCGCRGESCSCCYKGATIDGLESHRAKYATDLAAAGGPDVWSGSHPDEASCIALNLYAQWNIKGRTYLSRTTAVLYGHVDVNGLSRRATWDVATRAWVAKPADTTVPVNEASEISEDSPESTAKPKVKRERVPHPKMGKASWKPSKRVTVWQRKNNGVTA
jgi:hypothetical protein